MTERHAVQHPLPPVADAESRVLILGSFPSEASRTAGFYYAHPQNRFWRTLAAVYEVPCPVTTPEKRTFLQSRHIALWDVIASCTVCGSADASVRDVTPNAIAALVEKTGVQHLFCNGRLAMKCYLAYVTPRPSCPCVCLPSTSPANAAFRPQQLVDAWKCIRAGDTTEQNDGGNE